MNDTLHSLRWSNVLADDRIATTRASLEFGGTLITQRVSLRTDLGREKRQRISYATQERGEIVSSPPLLLA